MIRSLGNNYKFSIINCQLPMTPHLLSPATLSMALLALPCSPFSAMELWAQAPRDHVVSRLESTVDSGIKPGDDFFGYANGAWLKATVIPAGKNRWAVRDDINERTRRQVEAILEDARTAHPGSLARKVADFRSAYLNQSAIEAKGVAPLKPLLSRIDSVGDKQALTRLLGSTMHADVDPLNLRRLHLVLGAWTVGRAQHPR